MNHGLYQLLQGSWFRWGQAGERHSGTSVFRGWFTLGVGPPRLTPVSRQGRRDLQECPGLELREWNTQWGMKMCHCVLSSKFLNYSNKEAEPLSVTCSGRREPNHKYHSSSMWTYTSLGMSVSSCVSILEVSETSLTCLLTCVFVSFSGLLFFFSLPWNMTFRAWSSPPSLLPQDLPG